MVWYFRKDGWFKKTVRKFFGKSFENKTKKNTHETMWSIATLYPSMILLHGNFMKQTKYDKIFMDIWGFPKMVVSNNHGFSYWKWSFWGVLGVPPFKETPIYFTKPFLPNGQHPWRTSARRMPDSTKHVRQRLLEQIRNCNDSHPPKVLVASHDMLGCNVLLMVQKSG